MAASIVLGGIVCLEWGGEIAGSTGIFGVGGELPI
jgi:hypothetical protein